MMTFGTRERQPNLSPLVGEVLRRRLELSPERSLLVAVSGIDGSGKGYVSEQLVTALERSGVRAVGLSADGWLNLPERWFSRERPAEHFYQNAFRFEEMFEQLVLPLQATRSVRLEAELVTETATRYYRHVYHLQDADVIVLEGIFLLKKEYRRLHDLAVWVDCSFDTALERALQRGQEGLSPADTIRAYETIYFPAQRIHFGLDKPQPSADWILRNDYRPPMDGDESDIVTVSALAAEAAS